MAYPEKIAVAVDTSSSLDLLSALKRMDWLSESEIHLVHVFQLLNYGDGLSFNVSFPFHENKKELTQAVVEKMQSFAPQLLPAGHIGKVVYECLFSDDPKEKMVHYLKEHHMDMVFIATRKKRGVFESSFATFFSRHSPCPVFVIRPEL